MEGNGKAIYEKGIQIGKELGRKQGIQQGLEMAKMEMILPLIKQLLNDQYNFDQIAKLLHLDEEDQAKYRELFNL